jgi:GNAT superfamily N-acetyltransferase
VLRIDRVGPGGGVPSDNAFGVALVTLWQRVVEAGGLVGFAAPVVRPEVAARAAGLVDEIRTGRVIAVAANRSHRLIGVALLRPGRGTAEHTGRVELIMVDPAHAGAGIGHQLMAEAIRLARHRGLQLLDLNAVDHPGLSAFFGRFGFQQWGRRPGWIRGGPDQVRDEIVWGKTL